MMYILSARFQFKNWLGLNWLGTFSARLGSAWEISVRTHHYAFTMCSKTIRSCILISDLFIFPIKQDLENTKDHLPFQYHNSQSSIFDVKCSIWSSERYYLHTISPSMVLERMQMLLCFVVFMCARTERVVIMVPFFM